VLLDDRDPRAEQVTDVVAPQPPPTTSSPNRRGAIWLLVLGGVVIIATAAFLVHRQQGPSGVDHRYEIPSGTAAKIDAGEDVAIVPTEMHFAPGDKLTITNDDDRRHQLGILSVDPGQTVSYSFPNKGVFNGACTLHSSGAVTIYVE
jgi:plastocyanin